MSLSHRVRQVLCVPKVEKHFCRMKIIFFHGDFLLEAPFLLSLGRDEHT